MEKRLEFKKIKEIKVIIRYRVTKEGIVCDSGNAVTHIYRSSTSSSDLVGRFCALMEDGTYLIPWDKIEKRKEWLFKKCEMHKMALDNLNEIRKLKREIK